MTTQEILVKAKAAAPSLLTTDTEQKNNALKAMADALLWHTDKILEENKKDMERARGTISEVMRDRLLLTDGRIQAMAEGILNVAALPDPVGRTLQRIERPDGLLIEKRSVPIGVIAIIYESRPNVTSDAAALCIKSGNACVLRGGKEAFLSANAITNALREGLAKAGLLEDLVQLVQDTTRQSSMELMTAKGYVDLLIPRGGAGLIRACVENATVNCIETGTGICHVYVDREADQEMALKIITNAKTSRPSVCNAEEVCVVHQDIAQEFLPKLKKRLVDDRLANLEVPVELRLDERAMSILEYHSDFAETFSGEVLDAHTDDAALFTEDKENLPLTAVPAQAAHPAVRRLQQFRDGLDGNTEQFLVPAGPNDFDTEFLDYILAVKVVDSLSDAITHISAHSTGHSDAIVTKDDAAAEQFTRSIDSSSVYVNASTRFTDGGEFGLGCEMGISTQKLHARGPMGLEELTTYKYII
ncbi:MAG: glutamate-5-semialdehyde dehydrogenase, partial [Lachnospiraceae bacterium]|nr:glutamate-5-semialdehyde dehydrogenase [Lachnospiraceae bacterium]